MTVSDLLEQPCNKSDNINKVVTSCFWFFSKLVDNCGPFFCLTHPVNFPCGRKPEYPEETHDFRQSVDFYSFRVGTGFESHWESSHWDLNLRPQRWKASALTTWPPKPLMLCQCLRCSENEAQLLYASALERNLGWKVFISVDRHCHEGARDLRVLGRTLHVPNSCGRLADFTFSQLCEQVWVSS